VRWRALTPAGCGAWDGRPRLRPGSRSRQPAARRSAPRDRVAQQWPGTHVL